MLWPSLVVVCVEIYATYNLLRSRMENWIRFFCPCVMCIFACVVCVDVDVDVFDRFLIIFAEHKTIFGRWKFSIRTFLRHTPITNRIARMNNCVSKLTCVRLNWKNYRQLHRITLQELMAKVYFK